MSEEIKNDEMLEEVDETQTAILLTDENGNDVAFDFLDLIKYEDSEYVIVAPVEEEENEDEESQVMILRLEEAEDGGEVYVAFEDEDLLEAVYAIFKEKWKDTYNFND